MGSPSLVIVDQINVVRIAIFKSEYESPITGNRNAPYSFQIALERMQSVSWQIYVPRLAGSIEVCKSESDPIQQISAYPAGVVPLMEALKSPMAKGPYHRVIVSCIATHINPYAAFPAPRG